MSAYNDGLLSSIIESPANESFFKFANAIAPHEGLYQYTDRPLNVVVNNNPVQVGKYSVFPVNLPSNAQQYTLKSLVCKITLDNYNQFPTGSTTQSASLPPPNITTVGFLITNETDFGLDIEVFLGNTFTITKNTNIPNTTRLTCFFLLIGY